MEIIIAIVVVALGAMFYFNRKPKVTVSTSSPSSDKIEEVNAAPYKVEEPVAPVVEETPALVKKPRKPRAPKAEKPVAKTTKTTKAPVAKKPRAKKA